MTINKYLYIIAALLVTFLMASCNKYLDVQPKGVQLLETVNDYDKWLNNSTLETSGSFYLNYLSDTRDVPDVTATLTSAIERVYTWQDQFALEVPGTATIWKDYYQSVYLFNTVIAGVEKATAGADSTRQKLKAEALLGRAYEYLSLVNMYGKVYQAGTAGSDLSVPFVTSVDVTDVMPERASVQAIYEHIIADLNQALPYLPANNDVNRFRGSVAAAYGVLARTYLYMGDYAKAAENAQKALDKGTCTIIDYNTVDATKGTPAIIKRADAIYARLGSSLSYLGSEIPTQDFMKLNDITDLRLKLFYTGLGDYTFKTRGAAIFRASKAYPNYGISVAEMYLIIAEAAARANNLELACNELHLLRKNRFPTASYTKYVSADQETVLKKILLERLVEFPFHGLRWFDMRRLATEGRMATVKRYNAASEVIATLESASTKYVLQIPVQIRYFNPDWP